MGIVRLQSRPLAGAPWRGCGRCALWLALLAAATLTLAAPARANVGETIVLRCTHNESLSGFSQADYRKALKELEADTEEYSDCSSLIRQAALAAAARGGGGGGAGSPSAGPPTAIAATPAQQRAISHAQNSRPGSVNLAGGTVRPGVVHVSISSALSSLPSPLLATLAFLLACLLLIVGGAARNRLRARRAD